MRILIVEDHPLIADAYKSAFNTVLKNEIPRPLIDFATTCDEALDLLSPLSKNRRIYDICFLDIRVPPSENEEYLSGEDIGILIKRLSENTKIILSTTMNDNYRIHALLKNIDPSAFIIKSDVNPEELKTCIKSVITDIPYYSKTVLKQLRLSAKNKLLLDEIDRKLLFELSKGAKMKDLPSLLPLSIAGIERRKRQIKQVFNLDGNSDHELLEQARIRGFI